MTTRLVCAVIVAAAACVVSGSSRTVAEAGFSRTVAGAGFSRTVVGAGFSRPLQQLTIWDGVFTAEQATRGGKIYADRCARCHGDGLQGAEAAPALTGPAFYGNWEGETLDALFERMRSSMPQDAPGSLSRAVNADVLAYMLETASYPAGQTALDPQAGALTRITVLMYRP